MISKAASLQGNIIDVLYKSVKNKFATRNGRRCVFYH